MDAGGEHSSTQTLIDKNEIALPIRGLPSKNVRSVGEACLFYSHLQPQRLTADEKPSSEKWIPPVPDYFQSFSRRNPAGRIAVV